MNNKAPLAIVGAVVIIAGIVLFSAKKERSPEEMASNDGVYCSSDGKLSNTMPIQSHRSYCIQSDASRETYVPNIPNEYSFSIVDDRGDILKDFEVTHEKLMHVIVVRKDLRNFKHLHPDFNEVTGRFTIRDFTFPENGQYRIFADFAASGGIRDPMGIPLAITAFEDVSVGSGYVPEAIGTEERMKTFDGHQVSLVTGELKSGEENFLTFTLLQNGKPVTDLQEYLGALGHSVIIREDTLDFIHTHPVPRTGAQNGAVAFAVHFPRGGSYKAFTQFQREGKVFTTDFVLSVAEGDDSDPMHDTSGNAH